MSPKNPADICVLVVEDRMAMRKIVKNVLQGMGVRLVLEAADGFEALNILRQRNQVNSKLGTLGRDNKPVEFIVCDWSMPKLSGIELLEVVRKEKALSHLPFIMLTAEGGREQIVQAIDLGVTDYVVKPFTAAVLEAKLRALLGLKKRDPRKP